MYNPIQKVKNTNPNVQKHVKKHQIQVLFEPSIVTFGMLENLLTWFRKVVFSLYNGSFWRLFKEAWTLGSTKEDS